MRRRILVFIFVLFSLIAKSEILVNSNSSHLYFYNSIEYFECEAEQYSIEEILTDTLLQKRFSATKNGINFPFPTKAYWLKLKFRNTDSLKSGQILTVENPGLDIIKVYELLGNELTDSCITGEAYSFQSRELVSLDYNFILDIPAGATMTVYMYLYNHSDEIFVPLSINPPHKFLDIIVTNSQFRLFKAGILFFILVAMLFLILATRTKLSLYFFGYVCSLSFFLSLIWGISQEYLWPSATFIGVSMVTLLINLTIIFAQHFNRVFLNTKVVSPLADKIIQVTAVLGYISLLLQLLPGDLAIIGKGALLVLASIASVVTPVVSILCLKRKTRHALYILLSALPILVTTTLYSARFYGLAQSNDLTFWFDTAFIIELAILTFGIIDTYRMTLISSLSDASLARDALNQQKLQLEKSNEALKNTIQEKEEMQQQLLQVHKLETIGKLAGGIAHDFNNLLTPIIGYTEMSMDSVPKTSDLHEDLGIILKSSKRAKELVNQILTFSKHFKEQAQYISFLEIADEVTGLLKSVIPSSIVIKHRYEEDDDQYLYADPTQIHQILMNVCTNAYHAIGEEQGVITIEHINVTLGSEEIKEKKLQIKPGEYIQVTVSDTGKGMDAATIRKVFDPFFTTKEKGKGTGLGLSVVLGIVKKMHGCIFVDSKVGVGTSFNVYLPLAQKTELEPTSSVAELDKGDGSLVLVVDDDVNVLGVVSKYIHRNNYSVKSFSDSVKAWEFFESNYGKVKLLITDQTMPTLKGNELSKMAKELAPDVPIILMTGYSETVTTENYSEFGIGDLVLKPVDPKELLHKVNGYILK